MFIVTRLNVEEPEVTVVGVRVSAAGAAKLLKEDVVEEGAEDCLDEHELSEIDEFTVHVEAHGGLTVWQIHDLQGYPAPK